MNGRDFTNADRVSAPLVAIVDLAFVRRYQLGQQPIGRTVRIGLSNGERRHEIVGVVGDSAYTEPRDGMMATMYVPLAQVQPLGETLILTINANRDQRAAVEREVAAALARTEPAIAFVFRTFDQFIDARITQERLIAMLSSFFGGLALLLASIGLYGIVAQAVRTCQAEIGLRLALGAQPSGIVRLVFHRVGVLVVAGLTLGLASSLWAAQLLKTLLFHVQARDPATFAAAAGVLVAAGLLPAWLPAWRAARLDPVTVLREGQEALRRVTDCPDSGKCAFANAISRSTARGVRLSDIGYTDLGYSWSRVQSPSPQNDSWSESLGKLAVMPR